MNYFILRIEDQNESSSTIHLSLNTKKSRQKKMNKNCQSYKDIHSNFLDKIMDAKQEATIRFENKNNVAKNMQMSSDDI